MTSRTVSGPGTGTPTGPGDRPHLPPVGPSTTSRRTAHKTPLAWLPWLLLGLLALTLLAAALLARGVSGDGSSEAASGDRAGQDGAAQGSGSGPAGEAPSLAAGGQDLLAVEGGRIGSLEGQSAEGSARVESVVADEGFWVGRNAENRVFVFLTPEARQSAGESGFQVEAGQTVSLRGTVTSASAELAERIGVTEDEGAQQLVQQGGYVEATEVRLAE